MRVGTEIARRRAAPPECDAMLNAGSRDGPPPQPTFETQSLEEARSYMSTVFRSHRLRLTGSGPLALRHQARRAGRVSLHWLRYGAPIAMSAPEMDRFYLFQFTLRGACEVTHGAVSAGTRAGEGYAVDPAQPLRKEWGPDCEQLIVRVDREPLDHFVQRETGVTGAGRLSFQFRPRPVEPGLLGLIEALGRETSAGHGLFHQRVAAHLEPTLMALLLATFPHSLEAEFARAAQPCAPFYVRRAEHYMRAHARAPIGMDELVAASGVSGRSLFAGFRRFRDTTPMGYLKAVRLELARADLAAADPGRSTVTDIAIGCGFTHMSKFARDFRARFGTAPQAILKAEPPDPARVR
ncbi:MAG: AraC family transcriptional regulator [Methylobacteriaceae bacterium]|nr:AraC family transcriptional regulator [Methylobacteriaceae bacterium]